MDDQPVFVRAVNALGRVPFRLNERIVEVEQALYDEDIGLPLNKKGTPLVPYKSEWPPEPDWYSEGWTPRRQLSPERRREIRARRDAWKERKVQREVRNQRIAVTSRMKGRAFYFPMQPDFRGRIYPVPTGLTPQGDDASMAMLCFAEKPKHDDGDGEFWRRVHTANVFGEADKEPFEDRVAWTVRHEDDIRKCAEDPLGYRWWFEADNPFQFLASCMAMHTKGLHAPVQLDGSCNVIQWYSAVTRDATGGRLVNLLPSDRPSDLYGTVAGTTKPMMQADLDAGVKTYRMMHQGETKEFPIDIGALIPLVNRGLTKEPILTDQYGSRKHTQVLSVRTVLVVKHGFPDKDSGGHKHPVTTASAAYIHGKMMDALAGVAPGAEAAMDWLRDCAKRVAAEGEFLKWVSPSGFPVLQRGYAYERPSKSEVVSRFHGKAVYNDESGRPSQAKQIDGAGPNPIHSFDGAHMAHVAVECDARGIALNGKHDAFMTHPETAGMMRDVVRNTFVEINQKPLLEDLYGQWTGLYRGVELKEPPMIGTLDVNDCRESTYLIQ